MFVSCTCPAHLFIHVEKSENLRNLRNLHRPGHYWTDVLKAVVFLVQAGYFCSVCDCVLRDSQSYLDHINGKYHNRALGMSMVVERSTADDVSVRWPCFLSAYLTLPCSAMAETGLGFYGRNFGRCQFKGLDVQGHNLQNLRTPAST